MSPTRFVYTSGKPISASVVNESDKPNSNSKYPLGKPTSISLANESGKPKSSSKPKIQSLVSVSTVKDMGKPKSIVAVMCIPHAIQKDKTTFMQMLTAQVDLLGVYFASSELSESWRDEEEGVHVRHSMKEQSKLAALTFACNKVKESKRIERQADDEFDYIS